MKAIYNKKKNITDKNVKLIDEAITCHFKALKVNSSAINQINLYNIILNKRAYHWEKVIFLI